MKVPLLDLLPQYASIHEGIMTAVTCVCDSPQFIMRPEVRAVPIDPELTRTQQQYVVSSIAECDA